MSYVLYGEEILVALQNAGHPEAAGLVAAAQAMFDKAAAALAQAAEVEVARPVNWSMGRFGAPFAPSAHGQPCPDLLSGFDHDEEWGSE
jgi:hypothetical protein